MDVVLAPSDPYHVRVGIGQAKFLRFSCMGGPADVVISLSTYAEHADPLLFLSLNPTEPPSFQRHDASSFGQWQEDAVGDHYVIAKAVSPRGGILGLVNMRHFAGEELDGILSIHCTFIVAFDTLFWDHLRSSAVCPIGGRLEAHTYCSGHGRCGMHGACECEGDYTGAACEHSKIDVVVAAEGRYEFKVASGHYQYFRVRVPPRFPGGYLKVNAQSEQPLVILVRSDDLPTKRNFELSNFDDWINNRNISVLHYEVMAADAIPGTPPMVPRGPHSELSAVQGVSAGPPKTTRRLSVPSWMEGGEVRSWPQLLRRAGYSVQGPPAAGTNSQDAVVEVRQLGDGEWKGVRCPEVAPVPSSPACGTPSFLQCELSCMRCVGCVKGRKDGQSCSKACDACVSPGCINTLALCAGNASCVGHDAARCEAGCGRCMACFDSNDRDCSGCRCCKDCLPLAAKCSVMLEQPAEYNRFVFVGIYNHPRWKLDRAVVGATATISLTADPAFEREQLPSSWVADLWDPFHDVRSLEITQRQVYPEGEQYIYDVEVRNTEALRLEVRLYDDRMTLLHIRNHANARVLELDFLSGPNVTHVLSSSRKAPKTFFDFDKVYTQMQRRVTILSAGEESWCAIFGAADGFLTINVQTFLDESSAPLPPVGFALVCVFALLLGIMVLAVIYGGVQSLAERLGMDPSIPLTERFASLVRPHNPHESTASLTRSGSLTGYIGSDVIDRSVEDQYLHRGGIGDDGI